jgi:hypothetical protein
MLNIATEKNASWSYNFGLFVIVLAASATYLFRQIYDPDFFWHLKTGEWIWQHRMLPAFDIFTHTTLLHATGHQLYLLTSYWLSQLAFFISWRALDWWGIYVIRLIMLVSMVLLCAKRKEDDAIVSLCSIVIMLVALLQVYPLERPQFFSFIFFACLIRLLESASAFHNASIEFKSLTLTALLMLFWTNMHGGVVVGQALLAAYFARELLLLYVFKQKRNEGSKTILIASLAGLVSSLLNPNLVQGLSVVSGQLQQSNAHNLANNSEYMSSLSVLRSGDYTVVIAWVIATLFIVSILASFRKQNGAFVVVAICITYFSFVQVRHVPFLLLMAIPVIVNFFSTFNRIVWVRILFVLLCGITLYFFAGNEFRNLNRIKQSGWIDESYFPVQASSFLEKEKIAGKMFNPYLWGGYLIWRLGPEHKVFIDGRVMDPKVFWDLAAIETSASWGSTEKPLWKTMFEKYGINYAIIPKRDESGAPYMLATAMTRDKDWKVVFQSYNSMVFVNN